MMFDNAFNEFFLPTVFPKQLSICPFVLCAILRNLVADFIQICDNF